MNKAPLTITASDATMTYGEAAPAVTAAYSAGSVTGEGPAALSTAPTCPSDLDGRVARGAALPDLVLGAAAANYAISYVERDADGGEGGADRHGLGRARRPTATSRAGHRALLQRVRGQQARGRRRCHTAPTCTSEACGGGRPGGRGTYPTSCSGAAAANYVISYVNGTLTVNKKALTITASSHTVTYGEAAPTVTPSFAGFVLTDNAGSSPSTQPTCSTTYAAGSPVSGSPYPTSCTGAAAANYEISTVTGTVTGQQGGADHHGVEPHGDLRRGGADGDAQLRRLRAH